MDSTWKRGQDSNLRRRVMSPTRYQTSRPRYCLFAHHYYTTTSFSNNHFFHSMFQWLVPNHQGIPIPVTCPLYLVWAGRVELPRPLRSPGPKPGVYTNFTTLTLIIYTGLIYYILVPTLGIEPRDTSRNFKFRRFTNLRRWALILSTRWESNSLIRSLQPRAFPFGFTCAYVLSCTRVNLPVSLSTKYNS